MITPKFCQYLPLILTVDQVVIDMNIAAADFSLRSRSDLSDWLLFIIWTRFTRQLGLHKTYCRRCNYKLCNKYCSII